MDSADFIKLFPLFFLVAGIVLFLLGSNKKNLDQMAVSLGVKNANINSRMFQIVGVISILASIFMFVINILSL
jgi:hypothetical protein